MRRTKIAISKCPCLTSSHVIFRCQNLIGKSKLYQMKRKWLLSLSWSPHTNSYGRDCWLQNITFIRTCVCVIVQVRSYPFSCTRNQKSKKHLDNNIIASSANEGVCSLQQRYDNLLSSILLQCISFMEKYIQTAASRENISGNCRLSSQKSWDLFGLFCQIEDHFAKCACMWKVGYYYFYVWLSQPQAIKLFFIDMDNTDLHKSDTWP